MMIETPKCVADARACGSLRGRLERLVVVALLVALGTTMGACGEEEPEGPPPTYPFEIEVSVVDENDNSVAAAPVELDGRVVGYTDREGLFEATITEQRGAPIELAIGEMDDYRVPDDAKTSEELRLKKSFDDEMEPVPVTMQAEVTSRRTSYLIWVEVECDEYLSEDDRCEDMPVLVDGEEYAKTDARGGAHFLLEEVPEETIEIGIDTPDPPEDDDDDDDDDDAFTIEPEDPTYEVELGLEPEVLIVRERFTDPKAKEEAEKPDPAPRPKPKPKPKPKPSDDSSDSGGGDDGDDDGTIELF